MVREEEGIVQACIDLKIQNTGIALCLCVLFLVIMEQRWMMMIP